MFSFMAANYDERNPRLRTLRRFQCVLGLFMLTLVFSGLTAFPLQQELQLVASARGIGAQVTAQSGLDSWIATVRDGLTQTYARYPWIAYGTDWLAFAHIAIAVFFIGPLIDPVRNVWVVKAGLIACALVIPLALVCGPIRQIPFGWQLIDCSFGVLGAVPLWYCLKLTKTLEK